MMTSNREISPPSLPTARSSIISESVFVTSTKVPSNKLYKIFYLLENSIPLMDAHQQTVINTPMHKYKETSLFHLNRLTNKKFHRRQQKFLKSEKYEKYRFNNATYCIAYCTIIIIGVTIGGWIGGLFEFISGDYNGCTNEHRGDFKCQIKYASLNITTHCINIFYKKSIPNISPYICLCRFRNIFNAKYRDCEFLHAKIQ